MTLGLDAASALLLLPAASALCCWRCRRPASGAWLNAASAALSFVAAASLLLVQPRRESSCGWTISTSSFWC